ncbi:MAG TPA: HPr kinase/phosphatase C-terminal domain-containing protein [Methylobacterium sp.]|jgi:serine kinase of HPr protein (carbohydrate metabolism regulator)|uniref:HPr kinase/phosphorylase n=1 Tax=Methylorubrum sp. B1-46 TaxID=2897334 RepID=UPI001E324E7D|nr:HPr kinase/phosphatase C-terminal domain-containing protein [Methylorubrum sp. B1-46]UGB27121.1 HPr kinase/phosphatase C-terminal domain-containing protein [Methylorubrum sp. B1-46]HEV2543138.1 HPr kinase/phosphatase C-terminal domain-containing protein [Methylobacterium sp.]
MSGEGAAGEERPRETVHASCVLLDEAGVLIRGPSGAGKSALCLALLDRFFLEGRHARLVGDDRVQLEAHHGRLVARPHPALAGLIEIRGLGPRRLVTHAPAAVVRLVVDLVAAVERLPEAADTARLLGVAVPRLTLEPRHPREYLIREALGAGVAMRTHPAALVPGGARDV